MTGILYDIDSACVQTGVYNVFSQIPYDITESGVTQSKMTAYSMVLACPQEVKVWIFYPDNDSLSGNSTFKGFLFFLVMIIEAVKKKVAVRLRFPEVHLLSPRVI